MMSKYRSKGFSLVEILLVIGLIAFLSVAAFIIFAQVRDSNNANTETQNVTAIIAGVRNLYGIRADYVGLTTEIVNGARIFPRSMYAGAEPGVPGQTVSHVENGLVEVEPWGPDSRMFAIIYRDVPSSLCVKIAQNYGKNVEIVMVDEVEVKMQGDIGSDPAITASECSAEDESDVYFIQK